jgi:hypothetical protein
MKKEINHKGRKKTKEISLRLLRSLRFSRFYGF